MLFSILQFVVLLAYTLSLLFLFIYSLGQLHLSFVYLRKNKIPIRTESIGDDDELPTVTIQLPVYNEQSVIERLIRSAANIEYPRHLLEIQLLDDSNDDAVKIAKSVIKTLPKDLDFKHIRRAKRQGFKAGALGYATPLAKGELIAIFDSDFTPEPDFLLKTIGAFKNPKIGVVQTRWGHLNKNYSLLTKSQAFGLDAHFTVEQKGRAIDNCFINFNGTAGVWRKKCIEDAGGWQSDTLTEDLDLSFRAQLKGWEFVFMEDVVSPAELPITVGAFKSQQYRWNKGAAETHLKVWKKVWKSPLDFSTKFHALLQLFKGIGFVSSFVLTIMSVPILYYKSVDEGTVFLMQILSFTLLCVVALTLFYYASLTNLHQNKAERFVYFIRRFPSFIAISLGSSLHNSLAVIEGYLKIKTPFIRTPKFNINAENKTNIKYEGNISWMTYLEGILSIYFLLAIIFGLWLKDYTFLPFHFLLTMGYGFFFFYSFAQRFSLVK